MPMFGVHLYPTGYSMDPVEAVRAAEERGLDSVTYPEHTHIPARRKTPFPGDGELRTAAMSGCHAEIATSQRRGAPRSIKCVVMTIAGRSCSPRGVPLPIRWRMTSPRLKPPA